MADPAKNYRLSMKPLHKGPLRQSMALEKSLLEPIYDGEVMGEFNLSDPAVRYNKWATCCLAISCQDPCCDEPCKAFCGFSFHAFAARACQFCSNSEVTLGSLPPPTKPIVHAETSTKHGMVRVTKEHVIIDRVEGLQNHTVVVPMSAIQEMRVEDAAYDLYALNLFCGALHFCRLTHPAQRLKLYGQPMKKQTNICCYKCSPTLIENGVASIPTEEAEELCEVIENQMKEIGKVPDGNAFVALKVEDQFGKLFGRGTVTVVSQNGRSTQFSEKNKIKTAADLENLSKKDLIEFLELNGSPHDFTERSYGEILDSAIALWGSIRSVPYTEFVAPFPKKIGGCCSSQQKPKNRALCECVIPKLVTERGQNPVIKQSKKEMKELGIAETDEFISNLTTTVVSQFSQVACKGLSSLTNVLPFPLPIKVTYLGKNEPPRYIYEPKMKKDMLAIIKNQGNEE